MAGFTPEQVFTDHYQALALTKQQAMTTAYECHPERFVRGQPTIKLPPQVVAINPLYRYAGSIETTVGVNFPTLSAAKERANLQ